MSRDHLKTMASQRGMDIDRSPSGYDNYLLWLAVNSCVADISEVPMETDSDPEKCCTAFDIVTS